MSCLFKEHVHVHVDIHVYITSSVVLCLLYYFLLLLSTDTPLLGDIIMKTISHSAIQSWSSTNRGCFVLSRCVLNTINLL